MVEKNNTPQELIRVGEKKKVITIGKEEKKDEAVAKALPFYKLLSYADGWDWTLMALGTLGAIVHGMAQPIGYLLLGKALDAYGSNIGDTRAMAAAIYKVLLSNFIILNFGLANLYKHLN